MRIPTLITAGLCAALVSTASVSTADVVLEWNEIMTAAVADQPPPNMNRFAAITQLAVYEAVVAAAGDRTAHSGTTKPAGRAAAEAAVIAAAHGVLRHYFPDRAGSLDEALARSLSRIQDGPGKAGGIAAGEAAARSVIASRANDGSEPPEF